MNLYEIIKIQEEVEISSLVRIPLSYEFRDLDFELTGVNYLIKDILW